MNPPTLEATAGRAPLVSATRPARTARWAITLAATAASTYALDAVATGAGLLLVASPLLDGFSHAALLAILLATYAAWAAGLRVSLRANHDLLETTGTSTNALSKLVHDLAARRAASDRVRRLAAAGGYVATEALKELPYYAGAFGATVLADSVSSNDALVFLAGANAGAALYEYALGRATQAGLARRRVYACFEDDWVPADYLNDYYGCVEPDERETIAFFVEAMREVEPGQPVLVFGTGPTLHHVFLAAEVASEIHLADYLPANLRELERWVAGDPRAHDWRAFVRYTLECEGLESPTDGDVEARIALTRAKITRLVRADARRRRPLGQAAAYATVISAYCADSATAERETWARMMVHIAGLVRPGGTFVTAALRRTAFYLVGGKRFPSASVDEDDLGAVLAPRFRCRIEAREVHEHAALGYSGIVLATAQRGPAPRGAGPRRAVTYAAS